MITEEEIQTAINKLKKGKASDNNGIQAEDIKTCDDATKETIKQIFNEVLKQESCTPEAWRRIRKKLSTKKGTKKMSETIAQSVLCQRCTNCSRPSCTTDFIPGLTENNQRNREGSVVQYQTWDHLATYRMIEQKCQEWGCQNVAFDD